jgi:photosystem II protein
MAEIQFARGLKEEVIPDVKLTRSRDAIKVLPRFIFKLPTPSTAKARKKSPDVHD